MKIMLKVIFLFSYFICSQVIAFDALWEYKAWETKSITEGEYRYTTNGEIVHGNRFGFFVYRSSCSTNILWLTISTDDKGLSEHIGEDVKISISIDGQLGAIIETPLASVYKFTSSIDIALFTNFVASERFINALKKGKTVGFGITGPNEISSKFDIPMENFSLSGFTADHVKAKEACELGVAELNEK
jgi:hypothetical protein